MHISWIGNSAIKVQTKPLNEEVTVLFDAYKPETGSFPRSLTAQVAIFTHTESNALTISGDPFIFSYPGECETHGVLLSGGYTDTQEQMIVRADAEQMSFAHLGSYGKPLNTEQLDLVSGVDILFISVGGEGYGYEPALAVKTINSIEPRIVIPMNYRSDTAPKALVLDDFLKEIGVAPQLEDKKVILKKKDLPEEEMKVIVVSKE